jgi:hypothetical protein
MYKNVEIEYLYKDPKLESWVVGGIRDDDERKREFERWKALTSKERQAEIEAYYKEFEQRKKTNPINKENQIIENAKNTYIYTDTVNSMENCEATILWLVVMGVGAIFNDRLIIWIVATIIWLSHIFRYKIREYKWDNGGKEEYFKQFDELNKNGGNK